MTTVRDVIADEIANYLSAADRAYRKHEECADKVIAALLSAPDLEPHPELAAKLNPWRDRDSAPRDGRPFLAYCFDRYPFSPAPTRFYDIGKWSGKSPDDRLGHVASRSGSIVTHWLPLPAPPPEDK